MPLLRITKEFLDEISKKENACVGFQELFENIIPLGECNGFEHFLVKDSRLEDGDYYVTVTLKTTIDKDNIENLDWEIISDEDPIFAPEENTAKFINYNELKHFFRKKEDPELTKIIAKAVNQFLFPDDSYIYPGGVKSAGPFVIDLLSQAGILEDRKI